MLYCFSASWNFEKNEHCIFAHPLQFFMLTINVSVKRIYRDGFTLRVFN